MPSIEETAQRAEDQRERCAELVTEVGEQLRTHSVKLCSFDDCRLSSVFGAASCCSVSRSATVDAGPALELDRAPRHASRHDNAPQRL